ncbi:MAG: MTH1187 family thiamine-binding protein [Streptosporangiaceae bacterium]
MTAVAAFSITPLGVGDSVGDRVAEAVRIVRASGLPSETNAMFTNVEGEWDEIMPVIRACIDKVAEAAPRVAVTIKLDWRPWQPAGRLSRDMESVERRLR